MVYSSSPVVVGIWTLLGAVWTFWYTRVADWLEKILRSRVAGL